MSDLIDAETNIWREDLITNVEEEEARVILAIPINDRLLVDSLAHAFTKNGIYSVKTAYMVGKSCNFDIFHQAWVRLWSTKVSPKVRHFWWRVCTSTLPVRTLIKSHHLI